MIEQYEQELNVNTMGAIDEETPVVDIKNAIVVRRQFFSHMKECIVTFRPNGLQFNTSCISFFEGITHILLMIDWEKNWFIIKPCDPDDKDGQRWCTSKDGVRKPRIITGKDFAERLYKRMNWSKGRYYKVCGTLARQLDAEDELILVFEMNDAEDYPMTRKSRKNAGVDDAEISITELESLDEYEKQREREKREREQAKAEGRETRKAKRTSHLPESWGDSLGVTFKQHQTRIEFPHLPSSSAEAEKVGMGLFIEDPESEHDD